MKRRNVYLPMAAIIMTAALAVPATAQQQVPFKGTFQGQDAVIPPTITTSGTGTGTLVGQFKLQQTVNVLTLTGSAHWIAQPLEGTVANEDAIDSTFVASADFSTQSLGYITVTEIHTITGGRGRFSGAQGSFMLHRTHLIATSDGVTHVTFGSFDGSITSPGAAH
jgi:hypothetical protein